MIIHGNCEAPLTGDPRQSVVKDVQHLRFIMMHRHCSNLCKVNRTPSIKKRKELP